MASRGDEFTSEVAYDRLLNRIDALSNQVERQQLGEASKGTKPKTWWESLTAFLALPAAGLALIYAFAQIQNERPVPVVNSAEVSLKLAEVEKTRAETAKLNYDLPQYEKVRSSGRKGDIENLTHLFRVFARIWKRRFNNQILAQTRLHLYYNTLPSW